VTCPKGSHLGHIAFFLIIDKLPNIKKRKTGHPKISGITSLVPVH